MAIKVVSNTGGLWSSPATWVGGVIPEYDSIAFTATSGNLIVDVSNTIKGIDFTNWTGTLDMLVNQGIDIADDTITPGFINMGSGGYTLANSGGNGYIYATGSFPTIITNTVGKINIYRFFCPSMTITGDWLQQGTIDDFGTLYQTSLTSGTFTMLGTQNFANGMYVSGGASANLFFNGTITFSDLQIDGGTYKVLGGTFVCPVIAIETLGVATKIDFNGYVFTSISFLGGAFPLFLDSVLYGTVGNISTTIPVVFDGAHGFDIDTFTNSQTVLPIITFKSLIEYKVNAYIKLTRATISASIPGSKAKLTLGQNIDQFAIVDVIATDIDSSNGRRVNNFYGTITNCDNWRIWNDNTLPQVCSTF